MVTCDELVRAGKIRHIVLSNDSACGINQFINLAEKYDLPRIVSFQNEYNLLRRRDESDVMETCALEEISYLAWSPLQMGILSGKYLNGNIPAGSRMSDEVMGSPEQKARFATRQNATVDKAIAEYLEIAKKHNLDVCQIAIAFTIRKAYMSSSIIGAITMEQLKTNIDGY